MRAEDLAAVSRMPYCEIVLQLKFGNVVPAAYRHARATMNASENRCVNSAIARVALVQKGCSD